MPTADVTHLIERAIRERLVLSITYHGLDGSTGLIERDPLAIRFNKSGHRVLWCWTPEGGHPEELLWDRIQDAMATGDSFPPRPWVEEG